jgi:hypothetical protein
MHKQNLWSRYSFFWVTLFLFVGSLVAQWLFGWQAFVDEQLAHRQEVDALEYFHQMMRDTMENWQSEFLQLIWQVGGLAFLYHIGSPQSKEGDDRKEEKLDLILQAVDKEAPEKIRELDQKYARK